jgi:hypothetical protein
VFCLSCASTLFVLFDLLPRKNHRGFFYHWSLGRDRICIDTPAIFAQFGIGCDLETGFKF